MVATDLAEERRTGRQEANCSIARKAMEQERKVWHPFRRTGCGMRGTLCFLTLISLVITVPIVFGYNTYTKEYVCRMYVMLLSIMGKRRNNVFQETVMTK